VASALEVQLKETPQGNGPLAEIEFWRERNANLSALVEQLQIETVKSYMAVLQSADSVAVQNFEYLRTELSKYHTEAKDNVRFLSTMKRHFKTRVRGKTKQLASMEEMHNAEQACQEEMHRRHLEEKMRGKHFQICEISNIVNLASVLVAKSSVIALSTCPSVRWSVDPSVRRSFSNCEFKLIHVNSRKFATFRNYLPGGVLIRYAYGVVSFLFVLWCCLH